MVHDVEIIGEGTYTTEARLSLIDWSVSDRMVVRIEVPLPNDSIRGISCGLTVEQALSFFAKGLLAIYEAREEMENR